MIEFSEVYGESVGTHRQFHVKLNEPGFTLLLGKEGSGKSTIFNTLATCLFDENPRDGKQKGGLFHPARPGSLFGVKFSRDGNEFHVIRANKHKTRKTGVWIERNGTDVTPYTGPMATQEIQRLLGMSYDDFLLRTYVPQGTLHLLVSGTPSQRWDFFSSVVGCRSLEAAEDHLTAELAGATKTGRLLSQRRAELEQQVLTVKARLRDTLTQRQLDVLLNLMVRRYQSAEVKLKTVRSRRNRIISTRAKAAEHAETLKSLRVAKSGLGAKPETDRSEIHESIAETRTAITRAEQTREAKAKLAEFPADVLHADAEKIQTGLDGVLSAIDEKKAEFIAARDRLESVQQVGDVCDSCLQGVPHAHKRTVIARLKATVADTSEAAEKLRTRAEKLRATVRQVREATRLKKAVSGASTLPLAECRRRLAAFEAALTEFEAWHARNRQIRELEAGLKSPPQPVLGSELRLAGRERLYQRMLLQAGRSVDRIEAEIRAVKELHKAVREQSEALDAVDSELHAITLQRTLLDSVSTVKRRVIERLSTSFLADAGRFFNAPLELDLGQRKFEILVQRKDSATGKPYSVPSRRLSGGERDKLSAAFVFALQNMTEPEKRTNLLMLDEPASHLSEEGWLDFLDVLAESQPAGKSVFIATHSTAAQSAGLWRRTLRFTRRGDESSIKAS